MANPYIAYALLIYAGLDGVSRGLVPPCPISDDDSSGGDRFDTLPSSYEEALRLAKSSDFIKTCLPEEFIRGAEFIRGEN